ncbi:PQ-loop repeat-containing protein [Mycoplasmopsis cynos]|uniref:PQ-loop repeat-containing protein n=1 Tax=Mycoplasmopsis cynos TaxID=171284 RepID=UPI002AFDCE3E|nr:PQ-loop repeat-containing protein [Mycoplasmopsis cynos]WQQ14545.1 PQ-loop repeat-containing protein [Mycoplasmopsis cynos]WQQ16225.1 PQ-loop repeat-containing protein [Mycoplasmopsis cynos]
MQVAILFFGILSVILMVFLPIPQLLTTLKTKNISNVSYPAFFIYYTGGAIFVAVMTMLKKTDPNIIINIIGNTLFVGIMALTLTLFMILDKKIKPIARITIIFGLWIVFFSLLIWWISEYAAKSNGYFESSSTFLTILTIFANSCTALPFIAQIIKTLKNKSAEGISFVLLCCGLILNISLGIYFAMLLKFGTAMWYVTLLFQTTGAIVYIIQILIYLSFKSKYKKIA